MTVCIAARTQGVVLAISDRMITSGDIEFEPPTKKVLRLSNSIAIMYSGDSALFAEIAQDLMVDVGKRIEAEPENWLNIRDVANLYATHWNQAKYRRAELGVLARYGLTRTSFVEQLARLETRIVERITDEISSQRLPGLEVLIAGIDNRFGQPVPSIYHVADDYVMCADQASFAAIGLGARHAESQFMLAKYNGEVPNGEALLLAYSAKKDSEIAPGVGEETDIVVIGPPLGASYELSGPLKEKLDIEHVRIREKVEDVRRAGREEVARFLAELVKEAPQPQQSPAAAGTAPVAVKSEIL